MSDDAKKLVLARRARFVAAALAGMSIACGKEKASQPCLSIAPVESAPPTPMPCLTITATPPPPPTPDAPSTTPDPWATPKDGGKR